ncbi:Hyaluronan-binding protein 2 [Amphibalanus amphitrite]|uniref:Hyaluronan-binding protein 2 n=1 Tax=Amphibalanus amphitrite TaxID=1232801 RepID=A0A6A4WPK4_AMPAM|nr:Hyaluronan-binding protein 2 [Amphibalanus amphitrite]
MAVGTSQWWTMVVFTSSMVISCGAISIGVTNSSDCDPPELSRADLLHWLWQHHQSSSQSRTNGTRSESQHLPAGGTGCSPATLCDPADPLDDCYHPRDACDGMADCMSGQDELHCDSSLCPFRRAGAISVSVSGSEELVWDDVNLRGCARFCTEALTGCVAFGYSAAGRRCRVFRSVSGLEDAPGWVLYVRQEPSELSSEMALETLPLDANPVFDTRTRVLSAGSSSRRVVGGRVVTYGTYPWQAQIQVYSNAGHFEHHCGGVLIGERLVLTAAHCLRPALTRLQVKLGQHDRRDASERFEQTFAVENALSHPGYGADPARGDADDIAVLKLRLRHGRPVVFSSHVQPLCLPRGPPTVGQECHISGWGKTDARLPDAASSAADILHGASVPIVSDSVCAAPELYGSRFVAERMVCAGHLAGGADTCQGDSGGPLACPGADGRWQLSGIVSFGVGCGDLLKPGVYTRVSYYVPWIERVVQLL